MSESNVPQPEQIAAWAVHRTGDMVVVIGIRRDAEVKAVDLAGGGVVPLVSGPYDFTIAINK